MRNKMKKISKAAKRAIEAGGTFTPTPRAYTKKWRAGASAQGIYTCLLYTSDAADE